MPKSRWETSSSRPFSPLPKRRRQKQWGPPHAVELFGQEGGEFRLPLAPVDPLRGSTMAEHHAPDQEYLGQIAGSGLGAQPPEHHERDRAWFRSGLHAKRGIPWLVNGASALQVLLVEALIAFILVFTVISTTTDKRAPAGAAAVAIGFALAAGVLLGGPVSGGAGNPARALGPMIVAGTYPVWFFYCAGPLLGGAVAALAFRLVGMANTPKVADAGAPKSRPVR